MRKPITLALAATAALVAAGAAQAQPAPRAPATRAEAEQRLAEVFGRMDRNGDGVLDAADRAAARRAAFDAIDADNDGAISFAEFEARRAGPREARAERAPGERGFGRRGGPGALGLARAADADNDGVVTRDEFTAAALARFDRADADRDGTISREERRGKRHERRRGRPARDAG